MGYSKSAGAIVFVIAAVIAAAGSAVGAYVVITEGYGDDYEVADPTNCADAACLAAYDAGYEYAEGLRQRRLLAPGFLSVGSGLAAVALAGCAIAIAANRGERPAAPAGNGAVYGAPPFPTSAGPPR